MRSLRIGLLLGFRQIQRASTWTTLLIIFVMMFTFLNLIALSGVLVGIIVGAERAVRESSIGDIVITPLAGEATILDTPNIIRTLTTYPELQSYSARLKGSVLLEANYKERRDLSNERDTAQIILTGIDPIQEDAMTHLSDYVVEGEYLNPDEEGYILIGVYYLKEYAQKFGDVFDSVSDVSPGDTVRISINGISKEMTVKGIVNSKVDEISLNTYIPEREYRRLFGSLDQNADQIVVRLDSPSQNVAVKNALVAGGIEQYAKIQTFEESLPKFLIDMKDTFNLLGAFTGSIGIVVASITIFIIIFINALSRRRYIGILKGIGVSERAIEIAYVLQAAFYALVGSLIGALVTYGFLVPYFDRNPIQFPFSDGVLVADPLSTFYKFLVLFTITLVAGFLPAWLITRQNTLNSILGRK
jgi:putative ABC transport system permease protein